MRHLINVGFIIILVVLVLYIFKDELFYSPPKIENEKISQKIDIKTVKPEEKTTEKQEIKTEALQREVTETKQEENIETSQKEKSEETSNQLEEKPAVENITGKGKVIEVTEDNEKIKGIIEIYGEKLNFEMKYDPDMMLLLQDAKKLNLPLTFVIKKEGNKAYIEDIK